MSKLGRTDRVTLCIGVAGIAFGILGSARLYLRHSHHGVWIGFVMIVIGTMLTLEGIGRIQFWHLAATCGLVVTLVSLDMGLQPAFALLLLPVTVVAYNLAVKAIVGVTMRRIERKLRLPPQS